MRVYLLALLIAATVAYLTTPLARWFALRWGAITAVRDRDVHAIPTPRLGGMAMFAGILAAVVMASRLPFFGSVYANPRPLIGIVGGAAMVCALGVADDIWDLDWLTKLMGQVLAAGFLVWQGVLIYQLPIGGLTHTGQTIVGSWGLWSFLTILTVVVAMNAVNFVDGLDGLAAGVLAIGGTAFFLYAYLLTRGVNPGTYANASLAALVLVVLVGACVGFLPHNVYPARIFMGDSGAMLLGFVFSAAAVVVTGQTEQVLDRQRFPAFLPMVLPFAVLLLPLLDMGLAIVRRVGKGKSPFHPDRMHLHHRLLSLGHSHRRAVAIMYVWTAVFAFGVAALYQWSTTTVLLLFGGAVVVATILTLGPLRGRAAAPPLESTP